MTPKQKELLDYLKKYIDDNDYCPSFDEMREELGLKSKSGIHKMIKRLEEQGRITRIFHKARAIYIVPELNINDGVKVILTMKDKQNITFTTTMHPDTIRYKFNRSPYIEKVRFKRL